MGAWNYGIFDDDMAYDVLGDLMESATAASDIEEHFDRVLSEGCIDYDAGQYALVSAAIVDSVINNTDYECGDEDYMEWIESLKKADFASLKTKAAKAVDAVISDRSELKALWEENEELYASWRQDKISLRERLR